MTPERWSQLRDLFHQAADLHGEARTAFLAQACGSDLELREELERLLEESDDSPGLLSQFAERATTLAAKASQPNFEPGTILARRFRVVRFLARGGMGEVYECHDIELGENVALKTILPGIAGNQQVLAMFKREIQLARKVTHPHVCRIYDLVQHQDADSSINLLSMELVAGQTLAEYLKEHGPLTPAQALPLIEQMASALEAAHKAGVIHRDFKPGNVMLTNGTEGRVVVMDFGLAFPSAQSETGEISSPRGTPNFMAPEQRHNGPITPATDIYTLGLVIREMTGGASTGVWEPVLKRCLQQDPKQRPAHPVEVAQALRTALYPEKPPANGFRWMMGIVAGLAIVGVSIVQPWRSTPIAFEKGDWVLLAGFENRTGDPMFDRILPTALERDLSVTDFVNVVDRARIDDSLRLMRKPLDTPLDRELAREVALRDGGVVVLVTGYTEKRHSAYVFDAQLVDPVSGNTLSEYAEQAPDAEDVWQAARRLSSWVRESLGEGMAQIDRTSQELERVTTRSLPALQAFSEADDAAMRGNWPNAAEAARRALAEDPNFASAHLWLAWALRNLQRPQWEHEIQRARELETNVTERERLFIEASFYMMASQYDQAVPVLEELVTRYPDHYFGSSNLANAYVALNRRSEAGDALTRIADLRPNDYRTQANVAMRLRQVTGGDVVRASQYARRARALMTPDTLIAQGDGTVLFFPFFAAWETGGQAALAELEASLEKSENFRKDPTGWDAFKQSAAEKYLGLGRIQSAREWLDRVGWVEQPYDAYISFVAGDQDKARAILERNLPRTGIGYETRIIMFRLRPPGVDQVIETTLSQLETRPNNPPYMKGEIALSRGNLPEAIALLQEMFDRVPAQEAAEALAEAYEQSGNSRKAMEVLEQARTSPMLIGVRPTFWIRNLANLARYYQQFGRTADARLVQMELQRRLEVADSDFPILKELK